MNRLHPDHKAFVDLLKEDPTNFDLHQQFAEWCDQNDQPELAQRQRRWSVSDYCAALDFFTRVFKLLLKSAEE